MSGQEHCGDVVQVALVGLLAKVEALAGELDFSSGPGVGFDVVAAEGDDQVDPGAQRVHFLAGEACPCPWHCVSGRSAC